MAEFIHFEAEHSDEEENNENESDFSEINSFINDESEDENDENYGFSNVQVDLEEANEKQCKEVLKE